ncbi:hypothetical protein Tco_0039695 [Tanacetum coccineum]
MSSNANDNGNLPSEDNQANIVRKSTPWGFANGPISKTQLQEMRNEFWHNVARADQGTKASTSGSGVGNKSLYEEWKETYDEDPYDDDDFDTYDLTDQQRAFANAFDIWNIFENNQITSKNK